MPRVTQLARWERLAASALLICVAAAVLASTLSDSTLETAPVSALLTGVAALMLVAWLYLLILHIGRMLKSWPTYGIGRALAVLFIPFFGVAFVSLRARSRQ